MCKLSVLILIMFSSTAFADANELAEFVHQDCGSCHGMTLKGGLGPALTVDALRGKNIEYLTAVISEGRPGTPMPPWKVILSGSEIAWIAHYLKTPKMIAEKMQ